VVSGQLVKAKFKLYLTEQSGRKTPITTRYGPNHVFEYRDGSMVAAYIGEIRFDEEGQIAPGEEKIVSVNFLREGDIGKYLQVGRKWWIHEGARVVGEAEIIDL
jgi:hypothetical protein